MRIISFSKKWSKLSQPEFTTFRFPRKDRDWQIGEMVQVYYKNRTPERERLGIAEIINKDAKTFGLVHTDITESEAITDGFDNYRDMAKWIIKAHSSNDILPSNINKLTLRWIEK